MERDIPDHLASNPEALVLLAVAEKVAHGSVSVVMGLYEQAAELSRTRRLVIGLNTFHATMDADSPRVDVVCDPVKLHDAEERLWDAIEAVLAALEPDEEMLRDMGGDNANEMISKVMEGKARFAELRNEALSR